MKIAPSKVKNKGGFGEFVYPDDPTNPNPGSYTITIGEKSKDLPGGVADTILHDSVHAASALDPEFQGLKRELSDSFDPSYKAWVKGIYEERYKGKYSGSNFANFDNFFNGYWLDGMVQNLLAPIVDDGEIEEVRSNNPKASAVLDKIERLFKGGESPADAKPNKGIPR